MVSGVQVQSATTLTLRVPLGEVKGHGAGHDCPCRTSPSCVLVLAIIKIEGENKGLGVASKHLLSIENYITMQIFLSWEINKVTELGDGVGGGSALRQISGGSIGGYDWDF